MPKRRKPSSKRELLDFHHVDRHNIGDFFTQELEAGKTSMLYHFITNDGKVHWRRPTGGYMDIVSKIPTQKGRIEHIGFFQRHGSTRAITHSGESMPVTLNINSMPMTKVQMKRIQKDIEKEIGEMGKYITILK